MFYNFKLYLVSHLRNCIACLGDLWRTPWSSVLTCLTIGVTLSLPCGFLTLFKNLQPLLPKITSSSQISIFFHKDFDPVLNANKITATLSAAHIAKYLTSYKILTPAEALQEFEQTTGQSNLLDLVKENPLPSVLIIFLKPATSVAEAQTITQSLTQWADVMDVKLDLPWLHTLFVTTYTIKLLSYFLAISLNISVAFIIYNTIRLIVINRQDHIAVAKLIGATNAFIRREFLYLGFWYGLFGGITAWLITDLTFFALRQALGALLQNYTELFYLHGVPVLYISNLLIISCCLGIIAAWLAINSITCSKKCIL